MGRFKIAYNGLGLAEGVEIGIQMFNSALKPNSIPNAEFRTNATLLASPCCAMWLFGMYQISTSGWSYKTQFYILW